MPDASTALASLADRWWSLVRHEFPLTAFLGGEPNDDPTMFREAPADVARRAAAARPLLAEIDRLDAAALGGADRATHGLLRREVADLERSAAVGSHWRPWLLPGGPEFNAVYFANVSSVGDVASARRYVERLATLPRLFADVRDGLREGLAAGVVAPRLVLERWQRTLAAAAAVSGESGPWLGPFARASAAVRASVATEAVRAREVVDTDVRPALAALAASVADELLPRARETVSCVETPSGADYYAFWLRHFTTRDDLDADAVHALGLAEIERIEGEMAAVAAEAGYAGRVDDYRVFLGHDASFLAGSAETLRSAVEATAKRIDGVLPVFFGRLPRTTYGVRSIPAALSEAMPAGYAQPNPADGRSAGVFWISSLPAKAPSWMHLPIALHEAWPGHLMHIALMQEPAALPAFRRANFTKYTACLEGWAMYCERLGVEMGLYETPHQHYGRLDMELWRACRLVVDTGIHARGWSRERAIDFMASRLAMTREAIEAEVDRYIAMPAQALAYLVGGLAFRGMREKAERGLGDRFDVRAFHDRLLGCGAATLPVLEASIDDWVAGRG